MNSKRSGERKAARVRRKNLRYREAVRRRPPPACVGCNRAGTVQQVIGGSGWVCVNCGKTWGVRG